MVAREQLSFPWLGEGKRRSRVRRNPSGEKKARAQPRLPWRVSLPRVRGDCVSGAARRAKGEEMCRHLTCRHNLLGELTRRPAAEAETAMMALLEGAWLDTCALDVADRGGVDDAAIAVMMGASAKRITQVSAEALYKARHVVSADVRLSHEFSDEIAARERGAGRMRPMKPNKRKAARAKPEADESEIVEMPAADTSGRLNRKQKRKKEKECTTTTTKKRNSQN